MATLGGEAALVQRFELTTLGWRVGRILLVGLPSPAVRPLAKYGRELTVMRILIADDDETSRRILAIVLKKLGHEVVATENGGAAWSVIQQPGAPQMAILDLMMPKIDGIEVCRRVRQAALEPRPYLLILTALVDKAHLVQALEAGADDYMVKPFELSELRARVTVATRVIAAEERLRTENLRLEELVRERATMLLHADRMASIGVLASGIAHEVNNPATFIAGNVNVLDQCVEILTGYFDGKTAGVDEQVALALSELPKLGAAMRSGVVRIESIVRGLRTFSHKTDVVDFTEVSVRDCIRASLELCHSRLKYKTRVSHRTDESPLIVRGSEQQLVQVFVNLIVNALDAMETCSDNQLTIDAQSLESRIEIRVEDSGPGIAPELHARVFAPFFTTKQAGKGTGLGLAISKNILEMHGGSIRAENGRTRGACFVVELPMVSRNENRRVDAP